MDVLESLLRQIATVHTSALVAGDRQRNTQVLHSRWKIGQFLSRADSDAQISRKFGSDWMRKLSLRLRERLGKGFALSHLYDMRRLYLEYRLSDLRDALSWRHYRSLLALGDREERERLQTQAIAEGWSSDELDARIRQRKRPQREFHLEREAWDFFEAKVIEFKALADTPVRGLDQGFRVLRCEVRILRSWTRRTACACANGVSDVCRRGAW